MRQNKRIIGVTGMIGSGKSQVSAILEKYGGFVVDADKISKNVTDKGKPALLELCSYFGEEILNLDGTLDRKKLAEMAFSSVDKTSVLNSITHKYILNEIDEKINELCGDENIKFLVIDAAIPVKNGFIDKVDSVWLVFAPEDIRLSRIMRRNSYTFEEAQKRIKIQDKKIYEDIAHVVIENTGTIKELEEKVIKNLRVT